MLDISMEFSKGILFIRLRGDLTGKTVTKLNREVTTLIRDNGVRNVLFNLSEIVNLDVKGIREIFSNYQICSQNDGQIFLYNGANKIIKKKVSSSILKQLQLINDESGVFAIIN